MYSTYNYTGTTVVPGIQRFFFLNFRFQIFKIMPQTTQRHQDGRKVLIRKSSRSVAYKH